MRPMLAKAALLLTLLLALPGETVKADSVACLTLDEMIAKADFIVIAEVRGVEQGTFRGSGSYPVSDKAEPKKYTRKISLEVLETIRGELPKEISVYDSSGLWDSLFQHLRDRNASNSGSYLIFLNGTPEFLTGTNGWASTLRIGDKQVEILKSILPESQGKPAAEPPIMQMSLENMLDRIRKQRPRQVP